MGKKSASEEPASKADTVIAALNSKYGEGSVVRLRQKRVSNHPTVKTGIYQIDNFVTAGGFPKSRISEIYGENSGGKTTLCLQTIAQAQKAGGMAAIVDTEHALDPAYAEALGVDIDKLLISQPDSAESALDIAESLAGSCNFDIIVVDSVAALVPEAESNGTLFDSNMGLHARLMSRALRRLTPIVGKSGTAFVFTNQVRSKIGVVYGNPDVTSGGRSLPFFASLRLEVKRIGQIKDGETIVGGKTRVKSVKNKFTSPFREVEVDLIYGVGLDGTGSLLDAAVLNGAVQQSGSWFSFSGERIGQGRSKVIEAMRGNQGLYEAVYAETKKRDSEGVAA